MFHRLAFGLPAAILLVSCASPAPREPGEAEPPFPAVAAGVRDEPHLKAADVREEPHLAASDITGLDAELATAAALITAEHSLQHLSVLAHDSMMGRDSERPEIWAAARYIAGEFEAMGLEPMDEDGDFIEEYPIVIPEMDFREVRMVVRAEGREPQDQLELQCGEDFATVPSLYAADFSGVTLAPVVPHDWYRANPGSIPSGSLVLSHGAMMQSTDISAGLRFGSWMENVQEAGADAVGMLLPPTVPMEMMELLAGQLAGSPTLDGPPMILMPAVTVERIFEFAGAPTPEMDPIQDIQHATVSISFEMPVTTRTILAPNVVARLPGTQQDELGDVVLTAHFDHEPPGQANAEGDSIMNGADDNASGTVGLLEVARAFGALPSPPERSVVFAAVSAEEMGLLGSAYLAENGPAPAESTAANLNMDMLSRNGPDSLFVFGQTYSTLGTLFRDVLESHPELGLRVRPGHQMPDIDLIRFSDQAPYLARGVPVLMFHSGFHPDLHTVDDEVERTDPDKLARTARLVFFLAHAVASDPTDPTWTEEGRTRTEAMQKRLGR